MAFVTYSFTLLTVITAKIRQPHKKDKKKLQNNLPWQQVQQQQVQYQPTMTIFHMTSFLRVPCDVLMTGR